MGHRSIVFVMEAESEEELYELLENLPLWSQVQAKATPLQRFEELQRPNQSAAP